MNEVWRLWKRVYDVQPFPLRRLGLLVAALVCLLATNTALSVHYSFVVRGFTSALQEKRDADFYDTLQYFMIVIMLWVPLDALKTYTSGKLTLLLTRLLLSRLMRDFLTDDAFYHVQVENAGLLVLEAEKWVLKVQKLCMAVLTCLLDLVAFSSLMFFLSGKLWLALSCYSLAGTCLSMYALFPRVSELTAKVYVLI